MPYVKILIHAVWATKRREPLLTAEVRPKVINHIRENARRKEIFIDTVNGYVDHVHCLFSPGRNLSISKAIQLLKGESSNWMNKQGLMRSRFEWADEYYAASVSAFDADDVRVYIDNQESHHAKSAYTQHCAEIVNEILMGC